MTVHLIGGRVLCDGRFLARTERLTARMLRAGKCGPKPKGAVDGSQSRALNALSP